MQTEVEHTAVARGIVASSRAFFQLPGASRPPCLPPRGRALRGTTGQQLRDWACSAAGGDPATVVHFTEFVSTDSRSVPHVIVVIVHAGGTARCSMIRQAPDQLLESDLRRALADHRAGPDATG